jgi:predicted nucleic acid-binding protein
VTVPALYVDTSAALRAVLETGTTPEVERRLAEASPLLTSRLSLVESARALLRLRRDGRVGETQLADAARHLAELWSRCEVWEITRAVCDLASQVGPLHPLRALDALHLATFLEGRRRFADLEMLTTDQRLAAAATQV